MTGRKKRRIPRQREIVRKVRKPMILIMEKHQNNRDPVQNRIKRQTGQKTAASPRKSRFRKM